MTLHSASEGSGGSSDTLHLDELRAEYDASQWLSPEGLRGLQLAALRRMVWHCFLHVPRLATAIGRKVPLSRLAHLQSPVELPVQRADDRRRAPESYHASLDVRIGWHCRTAGTLGEPQPVVLSRESCVRQLAVRMRAERWAGAPPAVVAAVWGRDALREPYPLDADQLAAFLADLATGSATIVSAPAAACAQLALLPLVEGANVRGVIARGEDVEGVARRFAEQIGAPLYPWYGATEVGIIASPCERNAGLHLHADHLLVEIVGADDRPVPPGALGRILVTDLYNEAAPYLRHELGDIGRFVEQDCACGRALPLLEVWGRSS